MANVQTSGNMHRNGAHLVITGPVEPVTNPSGRVIGFKGLMEVDADGEPTLEERIEFIHDEHPRAFFAS